LFRKFGSRFFFEYFVRGSQITKLASTPIYFFRATAMRAVISETHFSRLWRDLNSPVASLRSSGSVWGAVMRMGPAEC